MIPFLLIEDNEIIIVHTVETVNVVEYLCIFLKLKKAMCHLAKEGHAVLTSVHLNTA